MSGPKVIVGIPVFNGEDMISECLDCVVNQTYQNIEIRVYDNASTDRTASIVRDYANRDNRIKFIVRDTNVGAAKNFMDLLHEADAPYFMWRAHDDLSSLNFIEELILAFTSKVDAKLAVSSVSTVRKDRPTQKTIPRPPTGGDLRQIKELLFDSHASWFYGLWETDALKRIFDYVHPRYPHPWASDHLAMYPLFLKREIVMAPKASFTQRIVLKESNKVLLRPSVAELFYLRKQFRQVCEHYIEESGFFGWKGMAIRFLTLFYVGKRVYKLRKLLLRGAREKLFSTFER